MNTSVIPLDKEERKPSSREEPMPENKVGAESFILVNLKVTHKYLKLIVMSV